MLLQATMTGRRSETFAGNSPPARGSGVGESVTVLEFSPADVPGVTRTAEPRFRKLLLYPAELGPHPDVIGGSRRQQDARKQAPTLVHRSGRQSSLRIVPPNPAGRGWWPAACRGSCRRGRCLSRLHGPENGFIGSSKASAAGCLPGLTCGETPKGQVFTARRRRLFSQFWLRFGQASNNQRRESCRTLRKPTTTTYES